MSDADPFTDETLAALATPAAYPHDVDAAAGIETEQTHISWVFLTRRHVYKFRKVVDLGFLDFGTRAARNEDCRRELQLNRRLAPDVYLGIAPLLGDGSAARIGELRQDAEDASHEHCVVMRRLPRGGDALSMLRDRRLTAAHVDAVADLIATFHDAHRLGRPVPMSVPSWLERCTAPALENYRSLAHASREVVPPELLARTREATSRFVSAHADRFEARRLAGRGVDGHGDLHLEHVWFEHDEAAPLVIDCLEFRDDFRRIDAASDVAFLAMDLTYRGRRDLAERFLARYASRADDFDLYRVVDFFAAYRAAVRAKVAAISAGDPHIAEHHRRGAVGSTERHLTLASELLADPAGGGVVVMSGIVGTGKSSVAGELAATLGAVVVATDLVRKRMAGLAPTGGAAAPPGEGLYTRARRDAVYDAVLERAAAVVTSGRVAILDGTFARARDRAAALELARDAGVPAILVETTAGAEVVLERLRARRESGTGASDAGPEIYEASVAEREPATDWPRATRFTIATDATEWQRRCTHVAEDISRLLVRMSG
jgi:aminoglycoside phosphotransferase family enzyme/predicted kinase